MHHEHEHCDCHHHHHGGHHHHDHHHDHDERGERGERGRGRGRGRGRRRFGDLESLEALQRDLEQAAADIAERIRRIREREAAREAEPAATDATV
jgi:hypothetical protein